MHDLAWEDSPSSGVQRLRLERDDDKPPVERVTTIVRFAPGGSFSGHVHGGGEEFMVLDGTFSDQHADYPQGFYVRNPRGTGHAPHSTHGCTILVKLWQMHPDDQQQLAEQSRELYQRALTDSGYGAITTEIRPTPPFYYAEHYHQQYLAKVPNGYCGLGGTGVSCPVGVLGE